MGCTALAANLCVAVMRPVYIAIRCTSPTDSQAMEEHAVAKHREAVEASEETTLCCLQATNWNVVQTLKVFAKGEPALAKLTGLPVEEPESNKTETKPDRLRPPLTPLPVSIPDGWGLVEFAKSGHAKADRKYCVEEPTGLVQGLPVMLSGRNMIGIAFTGSGQALVFVLSLIMIALQEEVSMPINAGEGPFGLVICPPREVAR